MFYRKLRFFNGKNADDISIRGIIIKFIINGKLCISRIFDARIRPNPTAANAMRIIKTNVIKIPNIPGKGTKPKELR